MKFVNIHGFPIAQTTYDEVIETVEQFLKIKKFHRIVTLNPEMVVGSPDTTADLYLPDGKGLVVAAKLLKNQTLNQITGSDLTPKLFQKKFSFYLVGTTPEILQKALQVVPNVVGSHHGYFLDDEEIIEDIKIKRPDIVLAGLGFPKQDDFLKRCEHVLDYGVGIGVGGVFDILAGTKKRAPVWMQKAGLEWLFRGLIEPRRIKRWMFIPRYLRLILTERFRESPPE